MLEQGYGIMPNSVLFDGELSSTAKLVFCYISSLCAERGYCWASNQHIAERFGISDSQISRIISSLSRYIEIDNGSNERRRICLRKNADAPTQKAQGSLRKKRKVILQENITSKNNSTEGEIVPKAQHSSEAVEHVNLLYSLVRENYPFVKQQPSPADFVEMDRLHRIDKREWKAIDFIIRWSQQDAFWKQNIRSVKKLRLQFDTLMVRASSQYKQHSERIAQI